MGQHHDYEIPNLAHRLLQAVINGGSVAPVSADDAARLKILSRFLDLTLQEQWSELAAKAPALRSLEADMTGIPGGCDSTRSASGLSNWEERYLEVGDRVSAIVGPTSGYDDVVLSSRAAVARALSYLTQR